MARLNLEKNSFRNKRKKIHVVMLFRLLDRIMPSVGEYRFIQETLENVIFKTTLFELIKERFNDERSIEISTDEEMLWIRSSRKEYHEPLRNESVGEFPIEMVETEVQEAVQFAESSPDPAPEELFKDIYVEG